MTNIVNDHSFAVASWPVLALASPICGIVAAVIVANIAYRFWVGGLVGVPSVVLALLIAMAGVASLVWNLPPGQIQVEDQKLLLKRNIGIPLVSFGRKLDLQTTQIGLQAWTSGRTGIPHGVQLRAENPSSSLRIGVASSRVLADLTLRHSDSVGTKTTSMPQAVLTEIDFARLSMVLGLPVAENRADSH